MSARARIVDADRLSLRVIKVIDIANLLATEAFERTIPEDFEDFIDSTKYNRHMSVEALANILPSDGCDADPEEIHDRLYGHEMFGMLLQVGTPIRKHSSIDGWRSGWGSLYIGWVFGTNYNEAWKQAKNWAQERHAADLREFTIGGAK